MMENHVNFNSEDDSNQTAFEFLSNRERLMVSARSSDEADFYLLVTRMVVDYNYFKAMPDSVVSRKNRSLLSGIEWFIKDSILSHMDCVEDNMDERILGLLKTDTVSSDDFEQLVAMFSESQHGHTVAFDPLKSDRFLGATENEINEYITKYRGNFSNDIVTSDDLRMALGFVQCQSSH